MSWSGLQRETLEAMGFAVLLPRPAVAVAVDIATDGAARAAVAQRPLPERAAAARPSAPAAPLAVSPAHAPPRPAATVQDRLARALLRAAGRAPEAVDASTLLAQWPDPAHLRRDPAAKRALWPRLRALRRADA